jgi:hypothetical protein
VFLASDTLSFSTSHLFLHSSPSVRHPQNTHMESTYNQTQKLFSPYSRYRHLAIITWITRGQATQVLEAHDESGQREREHGRGWCCLDQVRQFPAMAFCPVRGGVWLKNLEKGIDRCGLIWLKNLVFSSLLYMMYLIEVSNFY